MDYEAFYNFLRDMNINFDEEEEDDVRYIYIVTPCITARKDCYRFTFDENGKLFDIQGGE